MKILTICDKVAPLVILVVVIGWPDNGVYGWLETPPWYNEFFGDGDFEPESTVHIEKHLSRFVNSLMKFTLKYSSLKCFQ